MTCIRKSIIRGSSNAKILFLAPFPSDQEELSGQAFSHDEFLLKNLLIQSQLIYPDQKSEEHIEGKEILFSNLVNCRPYNGKGEPRSPTDKEIESCLPFTVNLIKKLKYLKAVVFVGFYPNFTDKIYPSLKTLGQQLLDLKLEFAQIASFQFIDARGGMRSQQFGEARTILSQLLLKIQETPF